MNARKPDFFIVGAPKCGTTALHSALSTHPEVFLPKNKEPHFFGRDLTIGDGWCIRDEQKYLSLFEESGDAQRAGEASPWYLFSSSAAEEIHAFQPEAQILILLRDPVDLIHSVHLQHLNTANEDILDLADALEAEPERLRGERIPQRAPFPDCLAYRSIARLSLQVERYLETFGEERVKVLLLDDLRRDEQAFLREVCSFLGVSEDVELTMGRRNPSRDLSSVDLMLKRLHYRTRMLSGLQRKLPKAAKSLYRGAVRLFPAKRKVGISPELRAELSEEFSGEVARLSALIQRDLSSWCQQR
ncbi:MAG: sulfotransferase [Planctomycetes bacterium]|nr:sulfotransferase [Planctomycetota bacterium]